MEAAPVQYPGSKRKLAKHLLPIMLKHRQRRPWVEPFVGGANMIDKVSGKRIGADINPYLIALLKAIQNNWMPPDTLTKNEYLDIQENKERYPPEMVGFALIPCSYRAFYNRGFAQRGDRNYAKQAKNNLIKQRPFIEGVEFVCADYLNLKIEESSFIYCDPPYLDTHGYGHEFSFNPADFWEWCRARGKDGHTIYISNTEAPPDFQEVWSLTAATNLLNIRTEKLFKFNPK